MGNRWTLNDEHLNVDKYLRACANLYGYVTPRQFLKLYNKFNAQKINKEKYLLWMEKLQRNSYEYYTLYTNAIICSKVPHEKIDEFIYYQEGKKYYDPSESELLAYTNSNYRGQNEYSEEMLEFLVNSMKVNRLVAESFLSKLIWHKRNNRKPRLFHARQRRGICKIGGNQPVFCFLCACRFNQIRQSFFGKFCNG